MAEDGKGSESAALSIAMLFAGCMCALVAMEYVLKGDPKSGNLLSLCETLFVLVESIPGRLDDNFRPKPFAAPLSSHLQFAVLWSSMAVLANYAFGYKISVTMFTLIRSCNLIGTVVLGRLFFGCRYSWKQLVCVVSVSSGIFLASRGEAKAISGSEPSASCTGCTDSFLPNHTKADDSDASGDSLHIWMIGISMLAIVQVLQGLLGHVQSGFYKKYAHLASKNELSDEYLFTSQIVALVPLMFMWDDLSAAVTSALQSPPVPFIHIPSRIAWLILNCIADSVCLRSVFRTSAVVTPLTLTMILSVRKFLSTIVSIVWFQNPWTHLHSAALVLIFGGAFAYSQAPAASSAPAPAAEATGDAKKKSD